MVLEKSGKVCFCTHTNQRAAANVHFFRTYVSKVLRPVDGPIKLHDDKNGIIQSNILLEYINHVERAFWNQKRCFYTFITEHLSKELA